MVAWGSESLKCDIYCCCSFCLISGKQQVASNNYHMKEYASIVAPIEHSLSFPSLLWNADGELLLGLLPGGSL